MIIKFLDLVIWFIIEYNIIIHSFSFIDQFKKNQKHLERKSINIYYNAKIKNLSEKKDKIENLWHDQISIQFQAMYLRFLLLDTSDMTTANISCNNNLSKFNAIRVSTMIEWVSSRLKSWKIAHPNCHYRFE